MSKKARPEDYPEGIIPGQERWVSTLYDGVESAYVGDEDGPYYAARWAGGVQMVCYGETRKQAVRNLIENTPCLLAQLVEIGPRPNEAQRITSDSEEAPVGERLADDLP